MSIPIDAALKQSVETDASPNKLAAQECVSDQVDSIQPDSVQSRLDSDLSRTPRKAVALSQSFCDEIAPQATRYAMSIVRSWGDAEEIVQEAFCRLIDSNRFEPSLDKQTNQFENKANDNKALLFTMVRNLAIDQLRKNKTRRVEPVDTQLIADRKTSGQINDQTDHDGKRLEQLESSVETILKTMPNTWSEALQLKVNGGLSYQEISIVMKATHGQIRTWIFRARKLLQADLKQQGFLESNGEVK